MTVSADLEITGDQEHNSDATRQDKLEKLARPFAKWSSLSEKMASFGVDRGRNLTVRVKPRFRARYAGQCIRENGGRVAAGAQRRDARPKWQRVGAGGESWRSAKVGLQPLPPHR